MSLEEEHQALHRRGEMIKFVILVIILLLTVLVVAAARPLIFEQIVPAVMGWEGEHADQENVVVPTPTFVLATATPAAVVAPDEEGAAVSVTPATATPLPTLTPQTYQVRPGDNLTRIANRFGVTVQALIDVNNLSNPDRLTPGERLLIP